MRADVVVVDNASTDGTRELVERSFPEARVVACENHGFGHANNRAALTTDARYVVFLNPDTEIRHGSFADLVRRLDARALDRARGREADHRRRAASSLRFAASRTRMRAFWQALGSERFPVRASWLGERELDLDRYEQRVSVRLDDRGVHDRARVRRSRARASSTSASSCTRRNRHVSSDQARRVGGLAPPAHDDPPPRGQGRREPEARCAGRVLSTGYTAASTSHRSTGGCISPRCCSATSCVLWPRAEIPHGLVPVASLRGRQPPSSSGSAHRRSGSRRRSPSRRGTGRRQRASSAPRVASWRHDVSPRECL